MELELTTADGPVRAVWARDAEGALTLALSAPADQRYGEMIYYNQIVQRRFPFLEGTSYGQDSR